MYKLSEWSKKIKKYQGKNAYSRLQWLMNRVKNDYVDVPFIEAAKEALENEHKNTVAFLNNEIEKRK